MGHIHGHPEPHAARGLWVGHPGIINVTLEKKMFLGHNLGLSKFKFNKEPH